MKTIFFTVVLLAAIGVQAQMLDTIGAMGLSGQMSAQGAKSVAQGMNMMQQNQIVQNINMLVMDIKINSMGNYGGLSKNSFSGGNPFPNLDWNVGSDNNSTFYLQFNGVPATLCQRLVAPNFGARQVLINGRDSKNAGCSNGSKIKMIFE